MFDVNDNVRALAGTYEGEVGRIVVRKPIDIDLCGYVRHEVVYGVDFETSPNGRGYPVFFKATQLERI